MIVIDALEALARKGMEFYTLLVYLNALIRTKIVSILAVQA